GSGGGGGPEVEREALGERGLGQQRHARDQASRESRFEYLALHAQANHDGDSPSRLLMSRRPKALAAGAGAPSVAAPAGMPRSITWLVLGPTSSKCSTSSRRTRTMRWRPSRDLDSIVARRARRPTARASARPKRLGAAATPRI